MEDKKAMTEPLPLVPATCIALYELMWGFPKLFRSLVTLERPKSIGIQRELCSIVEVAIFG